MSRDFLGDFACGSTTSLRLGDQPCRVSPWRPPIKISGRGGAGNVHTTITPKELTSSSASGSVDDSDSSFLSLRKSRFLSRPRTETTKPRSKSCPRKASFGRGGAGNRRERHMADASDESPLPPLPDINLLEQQYLQAREAWRPHEPQSSGRGGAGNIRLPRPVARAIQIFVSVTRL